MKRRAIRLIEITEHPPKGPDLKKGAQKNLEKAQTQFPPSSFSLLPSVGRTKGNEENGERGRGM
jgi:hypothetical protein